MHARMDSNVKKEPLIDLVPFLEGSVHLKTEPEDNWSSAAGCVKEELQVAGNDPSVRCPIKAEPPDVSQEGATRCPQDSDWTCPGLCEADDRKSLQDYSQDGSIGERSSTKPPFGGWNLCIEGELPCGSGQVDPGRNPTTIKLNKKTDCGGTTSQAENAGLYQRECGDGFYSAQAGCSREPDKTHDGEEVYSCNLCQMQFKEKKHLKIHIRAHINEEKLHCKVCSRRFANPISLTRHSRMHTGEKRFQCKVCHKQFTQSCNLTSHSRIHSGEKPFQCKVCHKQFTRSSSLTRHSRIHSGDK